MPPSVMLFGPLDRLLADQITYVLLALALVNLLTRVLAHRRHVSQAESGGAEALSRHPLHVLTNIGLLLGSFYYLTLHHHGGMVMSTLVIGLLITDFFEFEGRKVEARRDMSIDAPKAAVVASGLVVAYAAYQAVFFIVEPIWSAIV